MSAFGAHLYDIGERHCQTQAQREPQHAIVSIPKASRDQRCNDEYDHEREDSSDER